VLVIGTKAGAGGKANPLDLERSGRRVFTAERRGDVATKTAIAALGRLAFHLGDLID
jgi:hypothetical protein